MKRRYSTAVCERYRESHNSPGEEDTHKASTAVRGGSETLKNEVAKRRHEKDNNKEKTAMDANGNGLDKEWNSSCPCYEIINIEFEEEDDSDSVDSTDLKHIHYIDYFAGEYGPLENVEPNIENFTKNITLNLSGNDDRDKTLDKDVHDTVEDKGDCEKDPLDADSDIEMLEPEWECPVCSEGSVDFKDFYDHFESQHKDRLGPKCPTCGDKVGRLEDALQHLTKRHMLRWACVPCKLGFDNVKVYADHMKTEHSSPDLDFYLAKGVIMCVPCDQKFDDHSTFERHLRSAHRGGICPVCDKRVPKKTTSMMTHIYNDHMDLLFQCAEFNCDREFKSAVSFRSHRLTHETRKKCPHCNLTIRPQRYNLHLENHQASHHRSAFLSCDICSLKYQYGTSLANHRRKHFHKPQNKSDATLTERS